MIEIRVDEDRMLDVYTWTALVKARAGWKCEECGNDGTLDAHRKDGDGENHKLSNGECLCHSCHAREHMHLRLANGTFPLVGHKADEARRKARESRSSESWSDASKRAWETRRKKQAEGLGSTGRS